MLSLGNLYIIKFIAFCQILFFQFMMAILEPDHKFFHVLYLTIILIIAII